MLPTEMTTQEFSRTYDRFAHLANERHWISTARKLRQEERGNTFLAHYLAEEYAIVFALDECASLRAKYGSLPSQATLDRRLYLAMAFAAQVTAIVYAAPRNRKRGLLRRVQGADAEQ